MPLGKVNEELLRRGDAGHATERLDNGAEDPLGGLSRVAFAEILSSPCDRDAFILGEFETEASQSDNSPEICKVAAPCKRYHACAQEFLVDEGAVLL